MTLNHELNKKYKKKEIITVCSIGFEEYVNKERKSFMHKIEGKWVDYKPPMPYDKAIHYSKYSHGICPEEYNRLLDEIRGIYDNR